MPATFLDLLGAKVALEFGALDPNRARGALQQVDQTGGDIFSWMRQSGIAQDQVAKVETAARQCFFLKGEDTYRRVLIDRQALPAEQVNQLAAQARSQNKRLADHLVALARLQPAQAQALTGEAQQRLEQETAGFAQNLRQRGYAGIESPSRMVASVVATTQRLQAISAAAVGEGTQILPQEVASGQTPWATTTPQTGSYNPSPSSRQAARPQVVLGESQEGPTRELVNQSTFPPELAGTGLETRYRITRKLGEGGMGAVYQAYALEGEDPERPVALKVVRSSVVGSERFQEAASRFKREILATSFCDHESVIQIFDAAETQDGSYYMAMEYLEGEQLDELIKRVGPLPIPRLVNLLEDALEGLGAIHDANIVHRDVKPQNFRIYTDAAGRERLKVMDLGIARVLDADDSGQGQQFFRTMGGKITGSPAYLSPEGITEPDTVDRRADLYSLGISIYRTAVGRLPFRAKEPTEFLPKHLYEQPPSLKEAVTDCPDALEELYFQLLEKIPDKRPQTAGEALEILRSRVIPALNGAGPAGEELTTPAGGDEGGADATPPPAPVDGEAETEPGDQAELEDTGRKSGGLPLVAIVLIVLIVLGGGGFGLAVALGWIQL